MFFLIFLSAVTVFAECAQQQIVKRGADPDVLFDGQFYYMSYTDPGTRVLPILRSTNSLTFTPFKIYDPGQIDPEYNYYNVWAPNLRIQDGQYILLFSAIRLPKNESGKSYTDFVKDGKEETVFYALAGNSELDFSKPVLLRSARCGNFAESFEQGNSYFDGDPEHIIRIDPELYCEKGNCRLFYIWFDKGNNISSVSWPDLKNPVTHLRPTDDIEEQINEAPCVFKRNGMYYLIYSHGRFNSRYGMSYVMADSLKKLSKRYHIYPLYNATYTDQGDLSQNGGHCSVVKNGDEYIIFYHKGSYALPAVNGTNASGFVRSIYRSQLHFNDDGTIQPLN